MSLKNEVESWGIKGYPEIVILTSQADSKGFCAGGDVKAVYDARVNGSSTSRQLADFFKNEYQLDYMLYDL